MGRQTARKGTQHGQLRKGTAGKRCKELEFSKLSERQYWMARSGGLISVALTFELTWRQQQGAWAGRRRISQGACRPKWPAVGAQVE